MEHSIAPRELGEGPGGAIHSAGRGEATAKMSWCLWRRLSKSHPKGATSPSSMRPTLQPRLSRFAASRARISSPKEVGCGGVRLSWRLAVRLRAGRPANPADRSQAGAELAPLPAPARPPAPDQFLTTNSSL